MYLRSNKILLGLQQNALNLKSDQICNANSFKKITQTTYPFMKRSVFSYIKKNQFVDFSSQFLQATYVHNFNHVDSVHFDLIRRCAIVDDLRFCRLDFK